MNTYSFSLVLAGPDAFEELNLDAIYARIDDVSIAESAGVQAAEFDRDAPTFLDAVTSAISDLESAVAGLRVVGLGSDQVVGVSDIAARVNRTRESIRQWVQGLRGPGTFPAPLGKIAGRRLWRWTDVAPWLEREMGLVIPVTEEEKMQPILNAASEVRRDFHSLNHAEQTQVAGLMVGVAPLLPLPHNH